MSYVSGKTNVQGDIYFLCIVSMWLFPISLLDKLIKFCSGRFRQIFSFGRRKKWLLIALDRWLSYTVMIVWEFAWVDSALVVLDEWSSYRGGPLNRFDCKRKFTNFSSEVFGKLTSTLQNSLNIIYLNIWQNHSNGSARRSEMLTQPPSYKCTKG